MIQTPSVITFIEGVHPTYTHVDMVWRVAPSVVNTLNRAEWSSALPEIRERLWANGIGWSRRNVFHLLVGYGISCPDRVPASLARCFSSKNWLDEAIRKTRSMPRAARQIIQVAVDVYGALPGVFNISDYPPEQTDGYMTWNNRPSRVTRFQLPEDPLDE